MNMINQPHRWKKGQSGNPRGRPPVKLNRYIKDLTRQVPISKEGLNNIIKQLLFHKSYEETKKYIEENKETMPPGLVAFFKAILNDINNNDLRLINSMLDRAFGKSTVHFIDESLTEEISADEKTELFLFRLYRKLHPSQQNVFNNPARQKFICMPRRWGKSFLVFSEMVAVCMSAPHSRCLYVGRSIKEAEKQFNEMKADWLYQMGLPPDTNLKSLFPEGSWIDVYGLGPGSDGNNIRGRKYKLVVFDEFFHLIEDYLEYFMEQVIAPMQRDYKDWREIRVGTIPETDFTYGGEEWAKAVEGKSGWKTFTTHDPNENPNISDFETFFKEKYPDRDINEPWVQREFFCRWVYDTETQVFPVWHTFLFDEPPPSDNITHILIGGDFGYNDDSAVVAVAWDNNNNTGHVFFEKAFNYATTPKGKIVQEYLDEVCCEAWEAAINVIGVNNLNKIVWRFDSANPADIQRLYNNVKTGRVPNAKINIVPAYKMQQEFMYERMRLLFRNGDLLVPQGGHLERELKQTIYVRDSSTGLVTNEIDDRFHPNLIVSLRYALEYVLLAEIGIDVHKLSRRRR